MKNKMNKRLYHFWLQDKSCGMQLVVESTNKKNAYRKIRLILGDIISHKLHYQFSDFIC